MIKNIYTKFLITFMISISCNAELHHIDDTELINILNGGENVIVLFTKTNCIHCDEMETVVNNIQPELKESIAQTIVKAHNSNLVSIYDPSKEPALVFFRHGVPILYCGETDGYEILQFLNDNKLPVVKELSDDNFEHLTQAASGATTGDWFIFFYSSDCIFCQRLYAVWEAVGGKLRHRLNVARINRFDSGFSTANRFGITTSPQFIFLRQGKVYRYTDKDYTPKSFISFAESGYLKQLHPDNVPPLPTFNILYNLYTVWTNLKMPNIIIFISINFVLFILIIVFIKFFKKKEILKTKESKTK